MKADFDRKIAELEQENLEIRQQNRELTDDRIGFEAKISMLNSQNEILA